MKTTDEHRYQSTKAYCSCFLLVPVLKLEQLLLSLSVEEKVLMMAMVNDTQAVTAVDPLRILLKSSNL